MFFETDFMVSIGGKLVSTVVSVKTESKASRIGTSCEIKVPLNCVIAYVSGGSFNYQTSYPQNTFKVGDVVVVQAQYIGYSWVEIFRGFVYDFVEDMPTTIKCLDYVYNLNLSTIKNLSAKTTTFKSIVDQILIGTGVTQFPNNIDFGLQNISFQLMSPAAILAWFKQQVGLNISLKGNKLYANLASFTANTVILDTKYNVIRSGLQKPETAFQQYQVTCHFITANGKKATRQYGNGVNVDQYFINIPFDESLYSKLGNEALNRVKQQHFNGQMRVLLYPTVQLYDRITYRDLFYPNKNGDYVCVNQSTVIDLQGFNQDLHLAYLSNVAA